MTQVIGKRARHAMLMGRMAEALGIDLEVATMRGRFDEVTGQRAIARCTGCEWGSECPRWLAAHEAGATDTPPIAATAKCSQRSRAEPAAPAVQAACVRQAGGERRVT